MEINWPSAYIKANVNVKKGDVIKLLDGGVWKEMVGADGKKKKVLQFNAEMLNGEVKVYTMNATTYKNLKAAWGNNSKEWMNKLIKAWLVPQMSFGKMVDVLIFTPEDWNEPTKEGDIVDEIEQ
jgi:hypothetical protein